MPGQTSKLGSTLSGKLPMVFAGKVIPVMCLLLITVIYSRQLGYEDYGKYQTMWVLISLCGTLLLFGLPSIILSSPGYSINIFFSKHRHRLIPAYLFLLLAGIGLCWFSAVEYNKTEKLILLGLVVLQTISIALDTQFIKLEFLKTYVLINTVYSLCFLLIHLSFLYKSFELAQLMSQLILLLTAKIILSGCLLWKNKTAALASLKQEPSLNHWFFTGLNEVVGIIGRWLDKIVLLYLLTASEFALYFNGSFEIPLFAVLVSAMENIMLAQISIDLQNKRNAALIFRESFKLLSLIAFPIFCFFLFAHDEFYAVIFQNKYDASIPVFLTSLFLVPLRITHYGVILQCYGKGNQLLLGSVVDIALSLLLMIVMYPAFGTIGIMLALVMSTYLQVIFYLFASAKVLNVTTLELVPLKYLLLLMAALLLIFYALSFLRTSLSTTSFLIMMFLIAAMIVLAGIYIYFSRQKNLARGNIT